METGRQTRRVRGASPRMVAGSFMLASLLSVILGLIAERSDREPIVQPDSKRVVTVQPPQIARLVLVSESTN